MGIAPSTYYAHAARDLAPTEAELAEAYLVNELFDLWIKNRRVYGRRKLVPRPPGGLPTTSGRTRWNG